MSQPKPPIPIYYFITELSIGGAQTALLHLLSKLDRNRFAPSVACLYNGDAQVAQQIRAIGIPVNDLGMHHKYRLGAFWRLHRLLRKVRPTILHTWMFHANIPGRLIGRLAKVPIIISSERTMGQEGRFRRWANRHTASFADRIVCVSQRVADFGAEIIGLPREKLVVIPNGIELENFQSLPPQAEARTRFNLPMQGTIIGAIGRPRPVKGFHILINAFAHLAPTVPNVHLLFVGNGPDRPKLITQSQKLNLSKRVTFLDDQIDIPALLHALDILALPSLHEGMPNSVLEAMAARLPVVATAVGGTPEVVVDGQTGLLVPPRDPMALAEAIFRLLENPELRRKMGQAGRRRVEEHFSIVETVRKTEQLYEELLAEKGLPR